jgi:hypothetical protein
VISAEGLCYLVEYPEGLASLEKAFMSAGWTPQYIVFFRRPDHYALSLHQTLSLLGVDVSFFRFAARLLVFGQFRTRRVWVFYANQREFVRRWKSLARGSLAVFNYDEAVRQGGVTAAFLKIIGAENLARLPEPRHNERPRASPFSHRLLSWPLKWRYRPVSGESGVR